MTDLNSEETDKMVKDILPVMRPWTKKSHQRGFLRLVGSTSDNSIVIWNQTYIHIKEND